MQQHGDRHKGLQSVRHSGYPEQKPLVVVVVVVVRSVESARACPGAHLRAMN